MCEDCMMSHYYISIKEELDYERKTYEEELVQKDWRYLKEESELFLIHAYSHLFQIPKKGYAVFGDTDDKLKYSQFYLNLAIGLELLLKSILLKTIIMRSLGISISFRSFKLSASFILMVEMGSVTSNKRITKFEFRMS